MGLLERLHLESDVEMKFHSPTRREKWFGKYKGGSVEFVINDKYREPGGIDWTLLSELTVFEKFAKLRPLADYMTGRGNEVKFMVSFFQFSVKFKDIQEAVWFRMNT